eukprot:jgi/Phyca11/99870/e_gw1.4.1253.1
MDYKKKKMMTGSVNKLRIDGLLRLTHGCEDLARILSSEDSTAAKQTGGWRRPERPRRSRREPEDRCEAEKLAAKCAST